MQRAWLPLAFLVACGGETSAAGTVSSAEPTASATVTASATAAVSAAVASPPAASSAKPAADPRLHIEGKVIQGAIVLAKLDSKVGRIVFPGHRAVVSEEGLFPIAFFRNAPKEEKMTVHLADGSSFDHVFQVEQRTYATEKIDGLPEHFVKLDAATKKKVAEAEKRVDAVRMKYGKATCYRDSFKWPVAGKVTSRYGLERVLNGYDSGIHWGVDIAAPVGAKVTAPACGTVVFAELNIPLSGHTLIIDHGHGVTSTFIHLAGFAKKVGDEVKQGDIVATVGMTGRTNGPHLHWGMNYFEIRTDPELFVNPMPEK